MIDAVLPDHVICSINSRSKFRFALIGYIVMLFIHPLLLRASQHSDRVLVESG